VVIEDVSIMNKMEVSTDFAVGLFRRRQVKIAPNSTRMGFVSGPNFNYYLP